MIKELLKINKLKNNKKGMIEYLLLNGELRELRSNNILLLYNKEEFINIVCRMFTVSKLKEMIKEYKLNSLENNYKG